jgi:hypothetical protein
MIPTARTAFLTNASHAADPVVAVRDFFPGPAGTVYVLVELAGGRVVEADAQDIVLAAPLSAAAA